MRDWAVELCMQSAPSYQKFIEGVGPGFSDLLGRHTRGRVPSAASGAGLADDEKAVARTLGHSEDAFKAARG